MATKIEKVTAGGGGDGDGDKNKNQTTINLMRQQKKRW
jgi:hypothetical protein